MDIILASGSPRRHELLKLIFDDFKVIVSDTEEICPDTVCPRRRPEYLAALKGRDVAKSHPDSLVIAADTAVFLGDTMLGKPQDRTDAFNMLSALSGRTHSVITGVFLCFGGKEVCFSSESLVEFFELKSGEIDAYIETLEPMDKAGSYGIQGKGALLVKKIEGDYFNIVGLPVSQLNRKIEEIMHDL